MIAKGQLSADIGVVFQLQRALGAHALEKAARKQQVQVREKAQQRLRDQKRDRSAASGRQQPSGAANRKMYAAA